MTLNPPQDTLIEPDQPIDTADEVIAKAEIPGDQVVSLNIEATAAASYAIDVAAVTNPGSGDWFKNEVAYDAADEPDPQDIRDVFELGDRWLRLRVTDPASNGETADVTFQGA